MRRSWNSLLNSWADWKRQGFHCDIDVLPAPIEPVCMTDFVDEVDGAISAMPAKLRATLEAVYVMGGPAAGQVKSLGCPEGTIVRRISRAHLILVESFSVRRAQARREHEREQMIRWLSESAASDDDSNA